MRIFATGDSFIVDDFRNNVELDEISRLMEDGDVIFTNLEVNLFDEDVFANPVSGGTWSRGSKKAINTLKKLGINCFNTANNHSLDYSYEGLLKTKELLDSLNLCNSGTGKNLYEASKPNYINIKGKRVAFIAAVTTAPNEWIASENKKDMVGRPGVNLIRYQEVHHINEVLMKSLQEISEITDINSERNLLVSEGFIVNDEENFILGDIKFKIEDNPKTEYILNEKDIDRLVESIKEAEYQSDYIIFSLHSHEFKNNDKSLPGTVLEEISKIAVDSGVDIVLGHGPHIVRGLEIYNGKPIFYSLGNFIFQNDIVSNQPTEFYEKYDISYSENVQKSYIKRSKNGRIGLGINPSVWSSIIAEIIVDDDFNLKEIIIHPISLGFEDNLSSKGLPRLEKKINLAQNELNDLSKAYGVHFSQESNRLIFRK